MFATLNASVSAIIAATMIVPTFAANASFASPGQTRIEGGNVVLVQQFEIIEDTGTSNRIIAAAMMRTLSQEIPAAVCHLHNGVDTEDALAELRYSVAKFDAVSDALLNGNEEMGIIGGEQRRTTAAEIEILRSYWSPIYDATMAIIADPGDRENVTFVYDIASEFFTKTDHLLAEIKQSHSNPAELLQSDLMLIDISARVSMMTQAMAYEACRVWSDGATPELVDALVSTKATYAASMDALTNGLPALGIQPPPTPQIAESLAAAGADWPVILDYLNRVVAGDATTDEERSDLYQRLVAKVHKLEEIEYMYSAYSKRVY